MSDNQVQAGESDPAATSLPNDQTVNPPTAAPAEATVDATKDVKLVDESTESKKDEPASADKPEEKDAPANGDAEQKSKRNATHDKRFKGQKPYKNQKKSTFAGEETSDPIQIRKQVEFYFSDSNLPLDKYLMQQTGGSENKSVPIKHIHSFSRMRRFQPYTAVVDALKESDFLEVTKEDEVRRKVPLSDKYGKEVDENAVKIFEDHTQPRSVYVKGFGEETEMTQFNIETFFSKYGTFNSVRLRRTYPEKKFKGSVFVEFETEKMQEDFLKLDPKPKYEGKDLIIMSKKEYVEMKAKDIQDGKIKAQPSRPPHYHLNNPRGRGGFRPRSRDGGEGGDGGDDKDNNGDWRERRDKFQRGRGRGRGGQSRGGRGRGNGRGGDRNRERGSRDENRAENSKPKPRVDARGIPIVESTVTEEPKAAKEETKAVKEESKKRPAEDGGQGNEAKKAKADEPATAA